MIKKNHLCNIMSLLGILELELLDVKTITELNQVLKSKLIL